MITDRIHVLHILLFLISILLSRAFFFTIDDPEGPNLLIVSLLALFLYGALLLVIRLIVLVYNKRNKKHDKLHDTL